MADSSGDTGQSGRRIKVVRLIDEYDLNGIGAELERRWTAEDDSRLSLRDLADLFNTRLVERAMAEAGMQSLDGDAENVYRLLADEDVSEAERTRARRRLEREGVDVDDLRRDFVSYQAVRTYLREYREAAFSPKEVDRLETETENLQRLRSRTSAVTESKLEQLSSGGHLDLGEFRTIVNVTVICEECGSQHELGELLDRGGCDCRD